MSGRSAAELERSILDAHARGDMRMLERLQAEYRSRNDIIRDGPPPQLVYDYRASSNRTRPTATTKWKSVTALTPAARAARIEEISDEVPELRPNAKPTITISLTRLAREVIHDELAFSRRFMEEQLGETGGWLFGFREGRKWLVSATDLGPGERMRKSVLLSYAHARHEVYRSTLGTQVSFSRKFLGCHHVHPLVGYTEPSSQDRKNALLGLEWRELNPADFALDLIISPHADRGWNSPQFHAWATRRDRWAGAITEPVTIEGSTRSVESWE
jgi:hypothetical protein